MRRYECRSCGQVHEGPPISYGVDAPALWYEIPEAERAARTELTSDLCVVDDQHFFILGNVEIPIIGSKEPFAWSVWVSLSLTNFQRTVKLWKKKGREKEPPYFGWLSTQLPCYPETLNLKTHVHTRPVGQRPFIELEPTAHPLAVEQREGISCERVQEIAETVLHDGPSAPPTE